MNESHGENQIATRSLAEGLDFACNLLVSGINQEVERRSEEALHLLQALTHYISCRYAGEDQLALEALQDMSGRIGADVMFRRSQLAAQLQWCKQSMGFSS